MALIRTKLKQLRNADVRYISLVDRSATRIPFRVLKRDKENKMGIDLSRVFKSENPEKPYVSALVVFAQKDETAGTQVTEAIKAHGFIVDRVQKSDEGATLVFAQTNQPKDVTTVRLSDQLLMDVANLQTPEGFIGEMVEKHGFLPDLKTATSALYEQMVEVSKSETPKDAAEAVLTSYAEYLNQMLILPANSFKLDAAITEIVKKCSCEADKKSVTKDETEEERKKRIKDHPPAEMAPADEEDDQKPPPETSPVQLRDKVETEPVKKSDAEEVQQAILSALTDLKATTTTLAEKVDGVVTEQAAQKKVLDGVVQKADTLTDTLKNTVVAPVTPEDRPAGPALMRVKKDDDPRTGNFDTAFLRRRK